MAQRVGFDLPCGAGHLGLQGAPGTLPSALGFESLRTSDQQESLAEWRGFPVG